MASKHGKAVRPTDKLEAALCFYAFVAEQVLESLLIPELKESISSPHMARGSIVDVYYTNQWQPAYLLSKRTWLRLPVAGGPLPNLSICTTALYHRVEQSFHLWSEDCYTCYKLGSSINQVVAQRSLLLVSQSRRQRLQLYSDQYHLYICFRHPSEHMLYSRRPMPPITKRSVPRLTPP